MEANPNGLLLKCLDCGKQFVLPIKMADGRACPSCGGRTIPQAEVYYGVDLAKGNDHTAYGNPLERVNRECPPSIMTAKPYNYARG